VDELNAGQVELFEGIEVVGEYFSFFLKVGQNI